MVFASPIFVFAFLPVALALHHFAPRPFRNLVLGLISLLFYAWGEYSYVILMIVAIAANYGMGLWVEQTRERSTGRFVLAFGIIGNVAMLVYFKYANFLVANWNQLPIRPVDWPPVHLPIGISFFTFEAIAYLVDVYRGETRAQRRLVDFGLFMTLFPHLIAGPVVRYRDLAGALASREVSIEQFASGVRRFVSGLAKKVLLANVLAHTADQLFREAPSDLAASAAWLALVCYTLQIYLDFAGYSDMAIGLGRMFGFELCENFKTPYAARSVTDFWRRWHISLSTWFRDYLFIPLGGSRAGAGRTYFNLMIVFIVCGFWHGANWTFLIWGLWHGSFLVLERSLLKRPLARLPGIFQHLYLLLAVMGGWVFFRADSMSQAGSLFRSLGGFSDGVFTAGPFLSTELLVAMVLGMIVASPLFARLNEWASRGMLAWGQVGPIVARTIRAAASATIFAGSTVMLICGTYNPFIYYRF